MEIIVEDDYLMVGLTPQFDHRKAQDTLLATNYWLNFDTDVAEVSGQVLSKDEINFIEEEIAAIRNKA